MVGPEFERQSVALEESFVSLWLSQTWRSEQRFETCMKELHTHHLESSHLSPEEVMKLIRWWDEMRTTLDEDRRVELGKNIMRSQSENLWTIGTVGLAPHPIVVIDNLHNVPERGYWGWDNRWSFPYHPETWYLSEE